VAQYITKIRTTEGDKQIDYNALANLPASVTDATNTVISPNADYAEVGEWADGNPDNENRLGYFVAVAEVGDNTIKIRKATSADDVRGVTVYNPAFSGNAAAEKYGEDGELLKQYNYVGVMGIVEIIDNGTCTVNGRCMPAEDGTAMPSTNNMGYAVLERVDATHILIAVEPGADMIQRVKTDIEELQKQLEEGGGGSNLLVVTVRTENGEYVSSHTYQEIKEFCDNGGDAVLCEEGTIASFFPLLSASDTYAFFGKQAFAGRLFVSQGYYINADGTVTLDQQMIEIPSNDKINSLIDEYLSEALGGDY
jgi:hypothetical protein